jgi:hypothetical protein
MNGEEVVTLPSVKGSRQSINVELPAAIVHNIPAYIKYLGILRADPEPNKLVDIVFDGLRNKYVVAALRARTFIHATFLSPMRLFTHHKDVGRRQIYKVLSCADEWIQNLGTTCIDGTSVPPPLLSLPETVITKLPQLNNWLVLFDFDICFYNAFFSYSNFPSWLLYKCVCLVIPIGWMASDLISRLIMIMPSTKRLGI